MAATRGCRPFRTAAANTCSQSPSPSRRQPPFLASSYTSVLSYARSAENWTVAGLRQVLISATFIIPRRSTKPDLLALYASLQSGKSANSSPPPKSAEKSEQGPQHALLTARTNLHSLEDRPPAIEPQQKPLGKPGPRPGCPQPPPSSTHHRASARNPSQRRASLRLHKSPR